MSKKSRAFIPVRLRPWIEERSRWNLSHVHVQMARELGMNPNKLRKLANHRQEPWKLPLPDFIARIYVTTLGPEGPSFCPCGREFPASGRHRGSIHRPSPDVLRLD